MIFSPSSPTSPGAEQIGGKGRSLLRLYHQGYQVPPPLCLATECYNRFVDHHRLREKINLLLHRQALKDMRWEEIWDICLEIRHLFGNAPMPPELAEPILEATTALFGTKPLAIRSSAPEEDTLRGSFAGLHDSFINIQGETELLKKIKLVWASLWSDRAVLYRRELGLDTASSSMAVIIQEFLPGRASGVAFSRDPLDNSGLVIEAVHGINQQLVDGTVAPERWQLPRDNLRRMVHTAVPPAISRSPASGPNGQLPDGSGSGNGHPLTDRPLKEQEVTKIASLCMQLEAFFGLPQDVEWTITESTLQILQSRPITTSSTPGNNDQRSWYLSLTRSYDNLLQLRRAIEDDLLPRLAREAEQLAGVQLSVLKDIELATEIRHRISRNETWTAVYWETFIPFAHGTRLFGQIYNDLMEPGDPFEFIRLLAGQHLLSTARNQLLHRCAELIRKDVAIRRAVESGALDTIENKSFQAALSELRNRFFIGSADRNEQAAKLEFAEILLQYASLDQPSGWKPAPFATELEDAFLARGSQLLPMDPSALLELARASYRIRDDDNLYVGRISDELDRAVSTARKRLHGDGKNADMVRSPEDMAALLEGISLPDTTISAPVIPATAGSRSAGLKARQLLGQPASRGLARGRARVINDPTELTRFRHGEILVIDAIDPTMTFVAPLAAAIVERRGGMLIHGAIIAREYGLPCITGVPNVTELINSGEQLTVDAYLGIVTVHAPHDQVIGD